MCSLVAQGGVRHTTIHARDGWMDDYIYRNLYSYLDLERKIRANTCMRINGTSNVVVGVFGVRGRIMCVCASVWHINTRARCR